MTCPTFCPVKSLIQNQIHWVLHRANCILLPAYFIWNRPTEMFVQNSFSKNSDIGLEKFAACNMILTPTGHRCLFAATAAEHSSHTAHRHRRRSHRPCAIRRRSSRRPPRRRGAAPPPEWRIRFTTTGHTGSRAPGSIMIILTVTHSENCVRINTDGHEPVLYGETGVTARTWRTWTRSLQRNKDCPLVLTAP
jgi:hypothetical protein